MIARLRIGDGGSEKTPPDWEKPGLGMGDRPWTARWSWCWSSSWCWSWCCSGDIIMIVMTSDIINIIFTQNCSTFPKIKPQSPPSLPINQSSVTFLARVGWVPKNVLAMFWNLTKTGLLWAQRTPLVFLNSSTMKTCIEHIVPMFSKHCSWWSMYCTCSVRQ